MYIDVKRIMQGVKVDDSHIILDKPLEIIKYKKKIEIRQLNWFKEWDKFSYWLGVFLTCFDNICKATSLPDSIEDLEGYRNKIRLVISNKVYGRRAFNALCKIAKFAKLQKRWMKKHFTVDDYVEIFIYLYLYNVMGVKKNCWKVANLLKKIT